jgi:hypothetical protein
MVFPIAALFAVIKVACVVCGTGFCVHKITKAYNKGQKTKQMKLEYSQQEREAARKDNQVAKTEEVKENQKLEEVNSKLEKREKEIKKLQNKLKDPNLSPEEKSKVNSQLALLLSQQEDDEKDKREIINKINQLAERIKGNNKIINSTNSISSQRDWIWEVLTLENILVCLAIYALYNIVRDERKH